MDDILERTTFNATARIQRDKDGKYFYEVVVGILPIDDVLRFESRRVSSSEIAVADLFSQFAGNIQNLLDGYRP